MAADEGKPTATVLRIKVRHADLDAFVERFASQITRLGVFIPTRTPKPIGTEVRFEIRTADDKPALIGQGKVKLVRPHDPAHPRVVAGMAVELQRVGRDSRDVLVRKLEVRKRRGLVDGPAGMPMPGEPEHDEAREHSAPHPMPRAATPAPVAAPVDVAEPAYGLDKLDEHQKGAVYDLGGGTFDISVLEMREGVFQVLATAGDTQLGGDVLDRSLARFLAEKLSRSPNDLRLLEAAESIKKRLSTDDATAFDGVTITRSDLAKLAKPWLDRTRQHCLRALSDAKVKASDLDEVILVGGSTRMPLVRQFVAELFGKEPNSSQNPDEAIALGATIQAGILAGSLRQVLLLDVTPLISCRYHYRKAMYLEILRLYNSPFCPIFIALIKANAQVNKDTFHCCRFWYFIHNRVSILFIFTYL